MHGSVMYFVQQMIRISLRLVGDVFGSGVPQPVELQLHFLAVCVLVTKKFISLQEPNNLGTIFSRTCISA